jgi:hypothetical protein
MSDDRRRDSSGIKVINADTGRPICDAKAVATCPPNLFSDGGDVVMELATVPGSRESGCPYGGPGRLADGGIYGIHQTCYPATIRFSKSGFQSATVHVDGPLMDDQCDDFYPPDPELVLVALEPD